MSYTGYIPGSLLRETIERIEQALFADIDKVELQAEIEAIIRRETVVMSYGCGGCDDLEYVDDAAEEIIALVEKLLTPKADA